MDDQIDRSQTSEATSEVTFAAEQSLRDLTKKHPAMRLRILK